MLLHFEHMYQMEMLGARVHLSLRFFNVSLQNSVERFLWSRARGAVDAGVGAFMCAYNKAQRCDLKTF